MFYYRNVYLRVLKCVVLETPLLLIEIVEPISDLMMAALMLDATQPNPHECTYVNNPKNPEPEGSCTYSKNPEPSGSCTYVPNDAGTGPNPPTSHNTGIFSGFFSGRLILNFS